MQAAEIWNSLDIKLIAILRGITPKEIESAIGILIDAGFSAIEIPLNSPDPFTSISIASSLLGESYLLGGGTVLTVEQVEKIQKAGGNLIVSPNINDHVIRATKERGMLSAPGVMTSSECLAALESGADLLKIFPASTLGPSGIKSLSAMLPEATELCAVGGVKDDDFKSYRMAGITSFGLGTSLYTPALEVERLRENAIKAVQSFSNAAVSGTDEITLPS